MSLRTLTMAAVLLASASATFPQESASEVYSAFAAQTNNVTRTTRLQFTIDRWTTDVQRARLMAAVSQGGQKALLEELSAQDSAGTIRVMSATTTSGRSQYTLRFARQYETAGGGRQLVVALDRYIGFFDARRNPTTEENSISFAMITLDAKDEGEGQLMIGAELEFDQETKKLRVVRYYAEPLKLLTVKREK